MPFLSPLQQPLSIPTRARKHKHVHPARPRLGGSASFCALRPRVTTRSSGRRAGGAFQVILEIIAAGPASGQWPARMLGGLN
eukprot:8461425-Alexandrium_andersonii.AAC.1